MNSNVDSVEKRKLYIDGLNFSAQFGFVKKAWNVQFPRQQVSIFVNACRSSGWEPTVFIDAGIESAEALEKWKSRREQEVLSAVKDVPHGVSTLMGDIFRENEVTVHYSPWNADNDDCIAYFAQRDGASVLSNDIDFARYKGKTYEHYGSFKIIDGMLRLDFKKIDERRLPAPRDFLTSEPKMVQSEPGFVYLRENATYVRGSPCFATKFYGNFHEYVSKLRYKLYNIMGLDEVDESWPDYNDIDGVIWVKKVYLPCEYNGCDQTLKPIEHSLTEIMDQCMSPVLNVPDFTDDEKWNIQVSIMLVIAELYAAVHNARNEKKTTMLSQFLQLYNTKFANVDLPSFSIDVSSVCRNWKTDGKCKFGDGCIASSGHFICTCWRGDKCRHRH